LNWAIGPSVDPRATVERAKALGISGSGAALQVIQLASGCRPADKHITGDRARRHPQGPRHSARRCRLEGQFGRLQQTNENGALTVHL
jgi:hypothetical protein